MRAPECRAFLSNKIKVGTDSELVSIRTHTLQGPQACCMNGSDILLRFAEPVQVQAQVQLPVQSQVQGYVGPPYLPIFELLRMLDIFKKKEFVVVVF